MTPTTPETLDFLAVPPKQSATSPPSGQNGPSSRCASTELDQARSSEGSAEETAGDMGTRGRTPRRTWADDSYTAPRSESPDERPPPRKHRSSENMMIMSKSASGPGRLDGLAADSGSGFSLPKTSPPRKFSSASVSGSGNGRAQQRGEDLRRIFSLDCDENPIDDWSCALMSKRKILLQGRLYAFTNHICFCSNVFGINKKIVLPTTEIISIRKRKIVGIFPNSIEIVHCGRAHFFTSFLSRDEAYKAMTFRWRECSDYAKLFSEPDSRDSSQRNSSLMNCTVSDVEPASEGSNADNEATPPSTAERRRSNLGNGHIQPKVESSRVHFQRSEDEKDTDDESGYSSESSDSGLGGTEDIIWEPKEGVAPAVPQGYKTMLSETLNCTPQEFFAAFLSDGSTFWKDVLLERGDKQVRFDSWASHSRLGTVRSVYFVSPVKATIGPSETRCHQSQRYNVYNADHLVLETSQVMNDIPYGDHFSVEMRWDVTPATRSTCRVELRISIPFSRRTVFKGTIERTTTSETSACFSAWMSKAKTHLDTLASQRNSGSTKCVKGVVRKRSSDSVSVESRSVADGDDACCSPPSPSARTEAGHSKSAAALIQSWVASHSTLLQQWMWVALALLLLLNLYLLTSGRGRCGCQDAKIATNGLMQENMLMMQQKMLDTQQELAHVTRQLSEMAGKLTLTGVQECTQ